MKHFMLICAALAFLTGMLAVVDFQTTPGYQPWSSAAAGVLIMIACLLLHESGKVK